MFLRSALYDTRKCTPFTFLARTSLEARRVAPLDVRTLSYNPSALKKAPGPSFQPSRDALSRPASGGKLRLQDAKFDALMWKLQVGLTEQDLVKIRESYLAFVKSERQAQPATYTPRHRQHEILMLTLDAFADAGQLDMLDIVLDLMHSRCGITVDRKLHQDIIHKFQNSGHLHHVFVWLTQMRHKPGNVTPTLDMWNPYIRTCRRNQVPEEFFRKPVACVRMSGCEPNEETYQAILDTLFIEQNSVPPMKDVRDVLEAMDRAGYLTRPVIDGLVHAYSRAKTYDAISHLEGILRRKGENFIPQDARVNTILAEEVLNGLPSEAFKLARTFVVRGFTPTVSTLAVVAPSINSASSLRQWEKLLGVHANAEVWETLIHNAPNSQVAMQLYEKCLSRGQRPTPSMLLPLLHNLCSAQWGAPSPANIDRAIHLLNQYVEVTVTKDPTSSLQDDVTNTTDPSSSSQPPHSQDDLSLYNVVLRAVVASAKTPYHLSVATSLLEEVRTREIAMDCITRTSFIILSMQCASTPQEAFDIYRMLEQTKSGEPALDAKGYTAVLGSFTKNFLREPSAFTFCMHILKDMHKAGHYMSVETFAIVLRQLAILAEELPARDLDGHQAIVSSIRRIHNHISIEAALKPDTVLWNQLMDAYQRAGCFRDAYKVWEAMFVSREFDYASVSIIWDACAFAGAYDTAKEIFIKLQKIGFVFNIRNWQNWVESLCRLGRIEDATKVVCIQMPQESSVKPTVEFAKLIMKFASRYNEESLVLHRLKTYLPDIYAQMR